MRVLIVDDVPLNRRLLSAILEAEGHEVLAAGDGLEALAHLERLTVDAVISDILMPNMDGYRLCYEIRKHPKLHSLPVLIYTSTYTSDSDEQLALEAGADKYLRKPASNETVIQTLEEFENSPRFHAPRSEYLAEQPGMLKAYSEVLVRKLEHKNAELELAHAEIRTINLELEKRVQQRTAELEAANQELEAFCYSAAHDLRTPIRGIVGRCSMIAEDYGRDLDEELTDSLSSIQAAALRMEAILDGLLKLSHIGKSELVRQTVDLSRSAESVIEELRETFPERNVLIHVAPEIKVKGDRDMLHIAMQNLVSNAWKFTDGVDGARIEVGRGAVDGRRVFYVMDNGVGFDMAHAKELFSPFQRLHPAKDFPGTGLGLAIVKRVIVRHGGAVWVESAPNEGTKVSFTLGD